MNTNNAKTGYDNLIEEEIQEVFYKLGSLISLIEDKHLSVTMVFTEMLKKGELLSLFGELTGADEIEMLKHVLQKYPILHKSKKIRRK